MTRVCLLGSADLDLRQTLLSHETAREALRTYDLTEPFENAIGIETVSLGAAVALLNDLNWYLVRYTDAALVREPSVSETEWLSRDLAVAIRDDRVAPEESGRYLKVYGLEPPANGTDGDADADSTGAQTAPSERDETDSGTADAPLKADTGDVDRSTPPRLVEPMYVTRSGGSIPAYDLRDVPETLVVRVTETEFSR